MTNTYAPPFINNFSDIDIKIRVQQIFYPHFTVTIDHRGNLSGTIRHAFVIVVDRPETGFTNMFFILLNRSNQFHTDPVDGEHLGRILGV